MIDDKGIEVKGCPIGMECCFSSCYWRKGDRCYFRSKLGRLIMEMKEKTSRNGMYLGITPACLVGYRQRHI